MNINTKSFLREGEFSLLSDAGLEWLDEVIDCPHQFEQAVLKQAMSMTDGIVGDEADVILRVHSSLLNPVI
tara:strand:- start:338 stop:550 length:213 start_codon:yes stop_codon:yes gene_type:complete